MSVFKKQRGDRTYVYFQLYGGKRRKVEYLGLENHLSTWEKAERLFLEYLDRRLADFYSQIPVELKNRIQPREERRRLPEALTPIPTQIAERSQRNSVSEIVKRIPREHYAEITEELRRNYVRLRSEQLRVSPTQFERNLRDFEDQIKPVTKRHIERR